MQMQNKEKYWLQLFPETFLWSKNGQSLVYNAKEKISFQIDNTGPVKKITDQLQNLQNLYCAELSNSELTDYGVEHFINKIHETSSGKITEVKADQSQPVTLVPILNLQSDVERIRKEFPSSVGEHIMDYLHSVNLFLNGSISCLSPDLYHQAVLKKQASQPDFIKIENLLNNIEKSALGQIVIIAEKMSNFPDFDLLINRLDQMHIKKFFQINWKLFDDNLQLLDFIKTNQYFLIISVDNSFSAGKIRAIASSVENDKKQVQWKFFITSEQEYEQAAAIIEELKLENTEIVPVYTGCNIRFFEDYIYLSEEDLQHPGLNRREVFAHQALNTNDFGKLIVMPDGKIFANLYHPPLGTIGDDIRELVYKEMDKGTSWRRIRDMKPCCDCVYQWLCPSPGNYELAIGKPNLCHLKP
jgi:pseudo-rSAM protein